MITKHGWFFAGMLPNGKVVLKKDRQKTTTQRTTDIDLNPIDSGPTGFESCPSIGSHLQDEDEGYACQRLWK